MADRVAAFRRDLQAVWDIAMPKERKPLERRFVQSVAVRDDPVTTLVSQLELAPFLNLLDSKRDSQDDDKGQPLATPGSSRFAPAGGSDGGRFSVRELFRPRRVVIPDLRVLPEVDCGWLSRRDLVPAREFSGREAGEKHRRSYWPSCLPDRFGSWIPTQRRPDLL